MTDHSSPSTLPTATRRNFRLSVLNGTIMMGAMSSVASPDLVMTAFAAYLTSNPLILGLIAPMQPATWSLPQLWMVNYMQRARRVLPIYRWTIVVRQIMWGVLIVVTLLSTDSTVLLAAVMAFTLVAGLASGVAGLPFIEVIGKVIPPRQRALVFGWRIALGSIVAVLGSQVVLFFTGPGSRFDFPTSYGLLFIVAAAMQFFGALAFVFIKEPDADPAIRHTRPSLGALRDIWRTDGNYRCYARGRTLFMLSSMAGGLVLIYGNQVLGVRLEMAGVYLLVGSILSPVFSVWAGRLSLRIGNRLPVAAGVLVQAISWALLLIASPLGIRDRAAEYYLILVYSITAIQKGLVFSNLMALGLNVTPEDEHALYIGALNTWIGIVALCTTLSGVIVEVISFQALFTLTTVLGVLGAWQFWAVQETTLEDT
ncbi:MAG: MFS transporter [Anaerolineae bacterium]|nr:MFS transporter [Anaerolineae bacterium]